MKLLFIAATCCCLLTASAQKSTSGQVKLSGRLKNFSNAPILEDNSELQYLIPPSANRVIVTDATDSFSLVFPLKTPGYFRLGYSVLYLSPGDDLNVTMDWKNVDASFSGKSSSANRYLMQTPLPHAGSFLLSGQMLMPSPAATLDSIVAAAARRKQVLDTLTHVSDEFRRLEYARIKADIINSCEHVPIYESWANKNSDSVKIYTETFAKLAAPVIEQNSRNFLDPSLLQLTVYRGIAEHLPGLNASSPQARTIRDWLKATALVNQMQRTHDKPGLKTFQPRIDSIKTTVYRDAASRTLTTYLAFGKGDKAVDFQATDKDGNPVSLSSLKGKVIYIDLWATWCVPCMAEMPHYEELKAKYKDNPAVAFVSLSIDSDQEYWLKSIRKRKAEGYQWKIDRNKLSAYNIVGIPRVLLIDKNFTMAEMNAAMPSDTTAVKSIEQLLQ